MIRRHLDLLLIALLTITVLAVGLLKLDSIFISFLGIIFVLFAPGYAVISAIFKENVLEAPVKVALGIGISLAISTLGGIAIYGLGVMLTRTSWTIFLAILIMGFSLAAFFQRMHNTDYLPRFLDFKPKYSNILLFIFSVLVISGAVYLSWRSDLISGDDSFTEFWIRPQANDVSEIEIGLHNDEQSNMIYDIVAQIDGQEVNSWEGITVQPDQEWREIYILPPKRSSSEVIVVYLYKDGDHTKPYRWVQIYR